MPLSWSQRAAVAGALSVLCGVAVIAQQGTVYVAFGDSITMGVGDEDQRGGYPPRLQALLVADGQSATVRNRGLGAETTTEGLSRIDSVLAEGGDVLLLMEGTNDIARNISIETTAFNLDEMASRAEAEGMDVVIGTIIPRLDGPVDQENALTQRRVEGIRDLAGTSDRMLADPFEVFITTPDLFEDFYDDDPEDHVGHPNGDGYDLLASVFFDVLDGADKVPPVTGLTIPATGRSAVRPEITIRMDVWDFGEGIDVLATQMLIDGVVVPASINAGNKRVHLEHRPSKPFVGSVEIGLRARDRATPPNRVDRVVAKFTTSLEQLDGDIDASDRVDGVDLLLLARAFGATAAETRYLSDADFNEDEVVDGDDLAVLAANFGREREE